MNFASRSKNFVIMQIKSGFDWNPIPWPDGRQPANQLNFFLYQRLWEGRDCVSDDRVTRDSDATWLLKRAYSSFSLPFIVRCFCFVVGLTLSSFIKMRIKINNCSKKNIKNKPHYWLSLATISIQNEQQPHQQHVINNDKIESEVWQIKIASSLTFKELQNSTNKGVHMGWYKI